MSKEIRNTKKKDRISMIMVSFCIAFTLVALCFTYRMVYLQFIWDRPGNSLEQFIPNYVETVIEPDRGDILDCNGRILASSTPLYDIRMDCCIQQEYLADGRKIKGTIHWLSADYAEEATVILYNRLFTVENMNEIDSADYDKYLNPESAVTVEHVKVEKALADAKPGEQFQFVRDGYYCKDTKRENTFNRVVTLKDSFKA